MKVVYSLIIEGVTPCGSDYTLHANTNSKTISKEVTAHFEGILALHNKPKGLIMMQSHDAWYRNSRKAIDYKNALAYHVAKKRTTKEELTSALEDFNDGLISEEALHDLIDNATLETVITLEEGGLI